MATQRTNPSVVKAIASLNTAQKAQQSGDVLGLDLAIREITLAAKQTAWQQEQKHNKEVTKLRADLFDADNKLKQALAKNAIRGKAEKAYKAGDNVLGDKYMALLSGQQRPDEIQQFDRFQSLENMTEGETQIARQFLDPNYKPSALDELRLAREEGLTDMEGSQRAFQRSTQEMTDEEKNSQLLDSLVSMGYISREEATEILQDMLVPPQRSSTTQEGLAEIDRQLAAGEITAEEASLLKQRIVAGNPPSTGSSRTDANDLLNRLQKYPAFGANRTALDRITALMPKDKGQKVGASLDAMLQGRTFDQIPDDQKGIIASSMGYIALADPPGGDITKRFNFAQNLLKGNIPNLIEKYNKVRGKLGRMTQTKEGIYRFLGQTADPDVAAFQATLERLVSDYVVLRSGATITDREFQRYLSTLPGIGQNAEVNDQMMSAMIESLNVYFSGYFNNALGEQWGAEATKQAMGEVNLAAGRGTQTSAKPGTAENPLVVAPRTLPEGRTLPPDQIQGMIEDAQLNNVSREDMIKALKAQGFDTKAFEEAWK